MTLIFLERSSRRYPRMEKKMWIEKTGIAIECYYSLPFASLAEMGWNGGFPPEHLQDKTSRPSA
jgi:hypothetical protein